MVRGDLVIVDFRPVNPHAGVRPALVVQNDRVNARMGNTVVVQVTTNIRRVQNDTQLLIDANHPDWMLSGLRHASAINCSNICTIEQADVARIFGSQQGTVWATLTNTAIKCFLFPIHYAKERDVYLRLKQQSGARIGGIRRSDADRLRRCPAGHRDGSRPTAVRARLCGRVS